MSRPATKYQLQPLRIPTGWTVRWNSFYTIDPADLASDDVQWLLDEDLLQMSQEHFNRVLDVGWYPALNVLKGTYALVVYEGDFHGKLLFEHRTRDHAQLVAKIEQLLQDVCDGRL